MVMKPLHHPDPEVLRLALELMGAVRLPSYRCEFGNHDCDDADRDEDGNCPTCALVVAEMAAEHDYDWRRGQELAVGE
jgi:hypothetical protein